MTEPRQDDALDEGQEAPSAKRFIVPAILALALLAGGWFAVKSLKGGSSEPKRQTVKIAVLPDTPPPPPPPPPPDKKIEPEVKEQKPQPQEDQPKPLDKAPEPEQLKMEGAAGDGPSAFGQGSVSKDYQKGDPGAGGGGGANKLQFAFFTGRLTKHIQAELARNKELKGRDYKINVKVWLSPSGEFQRVELLSSSGDEAQDAALKHALSQIPAVDQPPANLPQPLTLRILNRVAG